MPATPTDAQGADEPKTVRLHITPLKPELLKVYLAPSVLPLARNVSYHAVETFPERGFGYVDLPEQEAQKVRKKLNGTTLKGSKVRIEMAKPEKRKAREDADADAKPAKRSKKDKKGREEKKDKSETRKRSPGVFDGVELPDDRRVKRGWTEPTATKSSREKNKSSKEKDKSSKDKDKKTKDDKHQSKPSKYTKEPELLFKAKLEPVAATEHTRKEKKKDKKDKKERKTKTKEVIVHEFEKNTKTPSFLKAAKVSMKPPVDYIDGVGWVDEDGAVVEPETKKAAHSRVLQLVDGQPLKEPPPTDSQGRPIVKKEAPKPAKKERKKKATPPPESSSESELDDESSVVSSSSDDESSSSDSDSSDDDESKHSDAASPTPSPAQSNSTPTSPQPTSAPSHSSAVTEPKEVHPLEALFKRTAPTSLSTPTKPPPINTSFSFFDNENTSPGETLGEPLGEPTDNAPTTPFTQRDLEWRGLRSAAPTPDTAAIGRRFSFDWRKGSQEDNDDEEEMSDAGVEAGRVLDLNTKANSQALADVAEEDEDPGAKESGAGKPEESEFRKWFWENRGDINRAWKKRRREALKAKRHAENRKMAGGRRVG